MILDVRHVLSAARIAALDIDSLSIVRIEATRQVFLAFGGDASHPACVVQFGDEEPLTRLHGVLRLLHPQAPDMIPQSLFCGPAVTGGFVHVQSGLRGAPWFRIRDRFQRPAEWRQLRGRAIAALGRLHTAISSVSEWRTTVSPAAHLHGAVDQLGSHERNLPDGVAAALRSAVESLEPLARMQWHWQHGDFCMNNLIVDERRIGVIDFEEFGKTSMPLHDEFGLALSLYQLGGETSPSALQELVGDCLASTLDRHRELTPHIQALFLQHLVHAINECDARPNRGTQRRWLWDLLQAFTARPDMMLPRGAIART